ncbi:hypothetical protein SFRURICE_002774, partial [Spodoptera frugiperda]
CSYTSQQLANESVLHVHSTQQDYAFGPQRGRQRCSLRHVMLLYNVHPLSTICVIGPIYQPLVVWCIINSLRIPHWDKVICNGDDDRGVSLLPYYTGHNFRSVLLLRHFRKSNKSPVIICPTLESNPRPLVSGSRIWSPLCQRGSPPTSKSSFCRFYFFGE